MRALFVIALAGLAASSAALAQPSSRQATGTLCLDGIGVNHPAVCHSQQASRFPAPPDICQCLGPWREVAAPYCGPGERPQAESSAYEHARLSYAERHGESLIGGTFQGRSMCVALGNGG